MAYRDAPDDEEDDEAEVDDREEPDEADTDDRLETELVPCPYCGMAVYEEAEVCPHCKSFITAGRVTAKRPWWVVGAAVVLLLAILLGWLSWVA